MKNGSVLVVSHSRRDVADDITQYFTDAEFYRRFIAVSDGIG